MTEKKKCTKLVPDLESHIQNNKYIKKLLAENSRLHNLIRDAYKEGINDGFQIMAAGGLKDPNIETNPLVNKLFKAFKESRVDKKKS